MEARRGSFQRKFPPTFSNGITTLPCHHCSPDAAEAAQVTSTLSIGFCCPIFLNENSQIMSNLSIFAPVPTKLLRFQSV